MNTIKTMLIVTVLSAVAYGVYVVLTVGPPPEAPPEAGDDWDQTPTVELPASDGSVAELPSHDAPPLEAAQARPVEADKASNSGEEAAAPPFHAQPLGTAQGASAGSRPEAKAPPTGNEGSQPKPADSPSQEFVPPKDAASNAIGAGDPFASARLSTTPQSPAAATPPSPGDAQSPSGSEPTGFPITPMSGVTAAPSGEAPAYGGSQDFEQAMSKVQSMLAEGRLLDALKASTEWYGAPGLSPDQHKQVIDLLNQLAGTVIYSRESLLEPAYEVQPGETLEQIAAKYSVPWQLLAKINGIKDPASVRQGDKLKVVRGPFDAVVDLEAFQLTLVLQGCYAGRFAIGIGRDQTAPEGEHEVKNKVVNPVYYGPDQMIDADDPANPLGERWIDLGNRLGIHSTNDPDSIGRADARGCIRLSPQDADDVFDILTVGSRVLIRR